MGRDYVGSTRDGGEIRREEGLLNDGISLWAARVAAGGKEARVTREERIGLGCVGAEERLIFWR